MLFETCKDIGRAPVNRAFRPPAFLFFFSAQWEIEYGAWNVDARRYASVMKLALCRENPYPTSITKPERAKARLTSLNGDGHWASVGYLAHRPSFQLD